MKDNLTKLYISAVYTSPPTTMGGNTKIMLEMIDHLSNSTNITVFTTEPETFKKNLKNYEKIKVFTVDNCLKSFKFYRHLSEIIEILNIYYIFFQKIDRNELKKSYIYTCSDFAPDVIPTFLVSFLFKIKWISSLYLFIPNPLENLTKKYKFPFLKYIVYFIYQKFLFYLMKKRASCFLITNETDLKMFPRELREHCFAVYGGVNIEEIPEVRSAKIYKYDLINCGRIHPQKGTEFLLKTWSEVVKTIPNAKLCIIGNGDTNYIKKLKTLQRKLDIEKNIEWKGYINGKEKYSLYSKSKIYAHPTVYDNNGMVAAEALCTGLPVIMFNLKNLRKIYDTSCIKIPCYDTHKFAKEIIRLIKDEKYFNSIRPSKKDINKLRNIWSWESRMKLLKDFLIKEGIYEK